MSWDPQQQGRCYATFGTQLENLAIMLGKCYRQKKTLTGPTMRVFFIFFVCIFLCQCTTYRVAKNIKLIGFTEDVKKGKSVGAIEGEECIFIILGYRLGGLPTVRKALANARTGRSSEIGDIMGGASSGGGIRYINNTSVSPTGFNAGVFGKDCITVTGMGYK